MTKLRYALLLSVLSAAPAFASVAEYQVTFSATWSAATHPPDFPVDPHFSRMAGGAHNSSVAFWNPGELASPGIEKMAETGSRTPLDSEFAAAIAAGTALQWIDGPNINPSPGVAQLTLQANTTFPLATLVSMIAPSPDWFVGVSGLPLQDGDGRWLNNVAVDLHPYDAGTDHGTTYRTADVEAVPHVPISDASDVFPFTGTPPLGTLTFQLMSITVNLDDHVELANCLSGPGTQHPNGCEPMDLDLDTDVDLGDFREFQNLFTDS